MVEAEFWNPSSSHLLKNLDGSLLKNGGLVNRILTLRTRETSPDIAIDHDNNLMWLLKFSGSTGFDQVTIIDFSDQSTSLKTFPVVGANNEYSSYCYAKDGELWVYKSDIAEPGYTNRGYIVVFNQDGTYTTNAFDEDNFFSSGIFMLSQGFVPVGSNFIMSGNRRSGRQYYPILFLFNSSTNSKWEHDTALSDGIGRAAGYDGTYYYLMIDDRIFKINSNLDTTPVDVLYLNDIDPYYNGGSVNRCSGLFVRSDNKLVLHFSEEDDSGHNKHIAELRDEFSLEARCDISSWPLWTGSGWSTFWSGGALDSKDNFWVFRDHGDNIARLPSDFSELQEYWVKGVNENFGGPWQDSHRTSRIQINQDNDALWLTGGWGDEENWPGRIWRLWANEDATINAGSIHV